MALNSYISLTQLQLHDTAGVFFSVPNLTTWINIARSQLASETQCVRQLQIVNTVNNQETYAFPTNVNLAGGVLNTVSVMGISVPWGTFKPTLTYMPWSNFQAFLRAYNQQIQGYPEVWSQFNRNGPVYLWPIPSAVFAAEWDTSCNVINLATDTDPEAIPYPFTDAIPYFAAYLANLYAQREKEAETSYKLYRQFVATANKSAQPLGGYTPYTD